MSAADYDEIMNTPHKTKLPSQQSRYFVRWSYKDRPSYNGRIIETYTIVDCDEFDNWLNSKRDEYLCFDLLIVNKM